MPRKRKACCYESPLAPMMERLVREKRASGYKYDTPAWVLRDLDQFLCGTTVTPNELPKHLVTQWLAQHPQEKPSTQQRRTILVRQLARLMIRLGYAAYLPPNGMGPRRSFVFSPRILTHAEMHRILAAVDALPPSPRSPLRHLILPEVFRLLYGCGFRLGEVLTLKNEDVDLQQGVITVRQGKFGKDRLVPPSIDMVERLRRYDDQLKKRALASRAPGAYFFPSTGQAPWHGSTIYHLFRTVLLRSGIAHGGRGKGPRIHDLRHYLPFLTISRKLARALVFWRYAQVLTDIVSTPSSMPVREGVGCEIRDQQPCGPVASAGGPAQGLSGFVCRLAQRTGI